MSSRPSRPAAPSRSGWSPIPTCCWRACPTTRRGRRHATRRARRSPRVRDRAAAPLAASAGGARAARRARVPRRRGRGASSTPARRRSRARSSARGRRWRHGAGRPGGSSARLRGRAGARRPLRRRPSRAATWTRVVALLTEDAWVTMPPLPYEYQGHAAIAPLPRGPGERARRACAAAGADARERPARLRVLPARRARGDRARVRADGAHARGRPRLGDHLVRRQQRLPALRAPAHAAVRFLSRAAGVSTRYAPTTDRVTAGVGSRPPGAAGGGEGADPRPRRSGRQAPPDAADGGRRRTTPSTARTARSSLLDLFAGRRQLIVYRNFFEPGVAGWPESGCRGCSMIADHVGHLAHLNARDTTLVFVSRAPQADIERWKARMGWDIPWYTITDDFDADFGVDEWHGTNVFYPRRRRPDLPHLPDRQARRRGAGQHLGLPRHHRARPPGGLGGLARGLPADPAVRVVEPPRRVRARDRVRGGAAAGHQLPAWREVPGLMIAHVAGVPLEELLPALGGAGASLVAARVWLSVHLRRRR